MMKLTVVHALLLVVAFMSAPARAAEILQAAYEGGSDAILVEIAYRGTNPDHDYYVQWGPCRDAREGELPGVAGRVIDRQGMDEARESFQVLDRLSLEDIPCRPALVTLRLGRFSHQTLYVPPEPSALR